LKPSTNAPELPHETRLERRLDAMLARATTPRAAAIVIAVATTATALAAGLLMTVVDRDTYPSIGSGLWWAAQTVTTVGYGDNVPVTVAGRLLAVLIMLVGISFLTVITAAITSAFVARSNVEQARSEAQTPTAEQFRQFDRRLERIEAALRGSSPLERMPSDAENPAAEQLRQIDTRLERIEAAVTRSS